MTGVVPPKLERILHESPEPSSRTDTDISIGIVAERDDRDP
jgi:hypothetical protein